MTDTPGSHPIADIDGRFYACVVDRVVAWAVVGAAGYAAYDVVGADHPWVVAGVVLGVALLVGLAFAIALGTTGSSPGKAAAGLRAVDAESGRPIGVGRAALRTLVLGAAGLPTFGFGLAMLAWTAVADPGGRRRGWHDHVAGSVVLDIRPQPAEVVEQDDAPRHVVNLTAMRLVPAAPAAPVTATERAARPAAPAAQAPSAPPAPAAPPPRPQPQPQPRPQPQPAASGRHAGQPPVPQASPWRLEFDSGQALDVDGLVLIGRSPEPRPGEPVRQLVALPSRDMSLSKTHAQVTVATDGALVVMDRGSTNGSVLIRHGVSRHLSGGRPTTLLVGDVVRLGDRQLRVTRTR